jgi:hypothetical protein
VKKVSPQELANLWYLKYEYQWVARDTLDKEWKDISRELMRNNLADYTVINRPDKFGSAEVVKLKEIT